ncbi:MAG: hypothetical protein ACREUE_04485 [Panacagrimonas sp.]
MRRWADAFIPKIESAATAAKVRQLEEVCREFGVALAAAAIQFVAVSRPISRTFWAWLKERNLILANAPTSAA